MTSPTLKRFIGIMFLLAAAVVAVLEWRKGDGPRAFFIPSVLLIIGIMFILPGKRA
jgi:hypothetical protein